MVSQLKKAAIFEKLCKWMRGINGPQNWKNYMKTCKIQLASDDHTCSPVWSKEKLIKSKKRDYTYC